MSPSSELLGRRQEGDAAGKEPDRSPEEPDEANPEGRQPALGEERSSSGFYGVGLRILCLEGDEQNGARAGMLQNAT